MYKVWYVDSDKQPHYCTKCRKSLIEATLAAGYNAYTGDEAFKEFWACPDAISTLLDTHHDVWEINKDYLPQEVGQ